ncbi:unnamed protein product, partial [marine sediment metagenome]
MSFLDGADRNLVALTDATAVTTVPTSADNFG